MVLSLVQASVTVDSKHVGYQYISSSGYKLSLLAHSWALAVEHLLRVQTKDFLTIKLKLHVYHSENILGKVIFVQEWHLHLLSGLLLACFIIRIVWASICIFSKLTRPSAYVLLPSWVKVMSFRIRGMKGITGGDILFRAILYARWFLDGSMKLSNSAKTFRDFDGSRSQVCVSLDNAVLPRPMTMAKKAFRFWYSLQLWWRNKIIFILYNSAMIESLFQIVSIRKIYLFIKLDQFKMILTTSIFA